MQHSIEQGLKKMMMSLISFSSYGKWNFESAYDTIYQAQHKSPRFREIVRSAFGDQYPEGLDNFSFVTREDLGLMAEVMSLGQGDRLADIACGCGGPGMWLARETGADLVGVDVSKQAVANASERIPEFGLTGRAAFSTGSFYHTGLETASCDAAVSVDALWVVPDRQRALTEIRRILKPGERFVFTTWDGNIPFMPDTHEADLARAGFETRIYRETRGWKERQLAVYEGVLNSRSTLIREMGKKHARPIIKEASATPAVLDRSRRIFAAAIKRSPGPDA